MLTRAALLLALLLSSGCCRLPLRLRPTQTCADGLPVRLLLDRACPPDGVCGSSCLPTRWAPEPAP